MKNASVLVVDDNDLLRYSICRLAGAQNGMEVIAEARTGREAVRLAVKHRPDMVVMDIKLPDISGIDVTRQILALLPGTRVIALSAYAEETLAVKMFRAGARGYLLKDSALTDVTEALRSVAAGDYYLSNEFGRNVLAKILTTTADDFAGRDDLGLTRRERQVRQLTEDGMTSKEISAILGVSIETVRTHRRNTMRKSGGRGRERDEGRVSRGRKEAGGERGTRVGCREAGRSQESGGRRQATD